MKRWLARILICLLLGAVTTLRLTGMNGEYGLRVRGDPAVLGQIEVRLAYQPDQSSPIDPLTAFGDGCHPSSHHTNVLALYLVSSSAKAEL